MQLSLLRAIKAHTIFLLSFVLLFTTGCEDDDHDNHDHGHTDADGFILESNGTEIYREFEGSVTGSVTLNVGDTLELAVHFLNHEGEEIEHEEEEGDEVEETDKAYTPSNTVIHRNKFLKNASNAGKVEDFISPLKIGFNSSTNNNNNNNIPTIKPNHRRANTSATLLSTKNQKQNVNWKISTFSIS